MVVVVVVCVCVWGGGGGGGGAWREGEGAWYTILAFHKTNGNDNSTFKTCIDKQYLHILTLSSLGKLLSIRLFEISFLIYHRKHDLTIHAICL